MRRKPLFRQSLFLGLSLIGLSANAGENLPDIEAHQFQATPVQKSKTGRIYLFKTDSKDIPKTGNVLLVHDHDKPAMAFRVIRTDGARSEYIAKKIRRYDQTAELQVNQKYFTIEKVADVIAAPTSEPAIPPAMDLEKFDQDLDKAPVRTAPVATENSRPAQTSSTQTPVQTEDAFASPSESPMVPTETPTPAPARSSVQRLDVESFDQDLDGTTSPQNMKTGAVPQDEYFDEEDQDARTFSEVEESIVLHPFNHSIDLMGGIVQNMSNFTFSSVTNANAFLMSYSHKVGRDVFFLAKAPQDSLDIEFGLGYYNLENYDARGGAYTITPLFSHLRYSLQFSESFALFGYAGFQYNLMVTPHENTEVLNAISGGQMNFGLGMIFTIGPHWHLRTDLGYDRIAIGLGLDW